MGMIRMTVFIQYLILLNQFRTADSEESGRCLICNSFCQKCLSCRICRHKKKAKCLGMNVQCSNHSFTAVSRFLSFVLYRLMLIPPSTTQRIQYSRILNKNICTYIHTYIYPSYIRSNPFQASLLSNYCVRSSSHSLPISTHLSIKRI